MTVSKTYFPIELNSIALVVELLSQRAEMKDPLQQGGLKFTSKEKVVLVLKLVEKLIINFIGVPLNSAKSDELIVVRNSYIIAGLEAFVMSTTEINELAAGFQAVVGFCMKTFVFKGQSIKLENVTWMS